MLATQRDPVRTVVPAVGLLIVLGVTIAIGLAGTAGTTLPEQPPVDTGATAWMLTSTALVLLMVPGLAMFYGGLVRTKNVLGTMMHSFAAMAIIGVLWVTVGYALAFGPNVLGGWIGFDPGLLFLRSIDGTVSQGGIPDLVFAMFQGKFAIITPALIAGAFAERVRFRGYVVFLVNDLRGMTARFELRSGSQPGTATMVVTAAPESVYQGRIDIDRNGTDALGLVRLGGLVQINSPFGRGDGFTATALSTTTVTRTEN